VKKTLKKHRKEREKNTEKVMKKHRKSVKKT
jgi:hypothetical protein